MKCLASLSRVSLLYLPLNKTPSANLQRNSYCLLPEGEPFTKSSFPISTMNASILVGLSALLMALAGCTGEFEVDQTEPIQVQIDDGDGETVTVRENEDAKAVSFDTQDVERVEVVVEVTPVSDGPCTIVVIVEDADGNEIANERIDVPGSGDTDDNMTDDGNETDDTDDGMEGDGDVVVQNIDVDVRGSKNIVVLTQAESGEADVNVMANSSSGNTSTGNQTQDDDGDGY
jgi:hypothetical protein